MHIVLLLIAVVLSLCFGFYCGAVCVGITIARYPKSFILAIKKYIETEEWEFIILDEEKKER